MYYSLRTIFAFSVCNKEELRYLTRTFLRTERKCFKIRKTLIKAMPQNHLEINIETGLPSFNKNVDFTV